MQDVTDLPLMPNSAAAPANPHCGWSLPAAAGIPKSAIDLA
jgi:hypothetical protein